MVVAVQYISKERGGDQSRGVTGILAVQGAFAEHAAMLDRLGAPWRLLRAADDFDDSIARVILPGGESTAQSKLLHSSGLFDPIEAHIKAGKPVLGTCAGLILLAKHVQTADGDTITDRHDGPYFATLPVHVRRNAYGRQLGSFHTTAPFEGIGTIPMTFIRAPFITSVDDGAETLATVDGHVVAARSGNQIGISFHPELDSDTRLHEAFLAL